MVRRSGWPLCLMLVAICMFAPSALAGGWAVVTLDSLPSETQAGQSISLGFMVRQHGITPIDNHPWEQRPLAPFLSAKNTATGETIHANARKEGPLGHFVVEVVFPSAGDWQIEITPPPFAGTQLGTFAVASAPATANAAQQRQATADSASKTTGASIFAERSFRTWSLTVLVILAGFGLTALVQREALARLWSARNGRRARRIDEPQPVAPQRHAS
jgi:hypothetical protein